MNVRFGHWLFNAFSRYWRRGHVPGALSVPYRMVDGPDDERLDELRGIPGPKIVVYGSESRGEGEALARLLATAEWPGIRWLEGGFEAWEAAGLEIGEPSESGSDAGGER